MRINWKRFAPGALVLTSLSLLLTGCGDYSSSAPGANGTKTISGVVSSPDNGVALSGAKVTAYAVDSNGAESATPLTTYPASATTNAKGAFTLQLPKTVSGAVVFEAEVPPSSLVGKVSKVLFSTTGAKIKAVVPQAQIAQATPAPVMISFATDAAVQFVKQNYTSGFNTENIQRANVTLESLFGANFTQVPPPASTADANTSKPQQDLLVSINALNSVITKSNSTTTIATIVTSLVSSNGLGSLADSIKAEIASSATSLMTAGTLPSQYAPSMVINTAISNAQWAPVATTDLPGTVFSTTPTGLTTGNVAAKRVDLSWSAPASGGSAVAGYLIYRADASNTYVVIDSVDGNILSYSDTFAVPQTNYSYKVVAFDRGRNISEPSNVVTAATPRAADDVAPSRPTWLLCKRISATKVRLHWTAATKTTATGAVIPAAGYDIYRDGHLITTVADTFYLDDTVSPNTEYTYYIKAADADANLSAATVPMIVVTPAAAGSSLPAAPANVQTTSKFNLVVLNWDASATQGALYRVYRDSVLVAAEISGTTYHDASVTPNSTYTYTVTAINGGGESPAATMSSQVTTPNDPNATDTAAPTVPMNLVAVAASGNSVALTWTASTKSGGDRIVAGYDILRGDGTGNNFVKIATSKQASYVDTTVAPQTAYSYMVRSFNTSGVRSGFGSAWAVATPKAADTADVTPPTVPTALTLTSATSSTVTFGWTASTKSTGDGITAGYLVYRDGAVVGNVSATAFTDTTVKSSASYTYTVKAYDNPGNLSNESAALTVTTQAAPAGTYNILGKVTLNGAGIAGVMLTDGTTNVVTDANGNYSFASVTPGTYKITSASAGYYIIAPTSRSVSVTDRNVTGQDFVVTLSGSATAGINYPDGTIIGGISYPPGSIIGGVLYPTGATMIGGVLYPTGTVIGGIVYPNGIVIGGISYPPGTIVGGVAFPIGAVTTGFTYPTGTVIGGFIYPNGTVTGGIIYPSGTAIGAVTYPGGAVIGGLLYPAGIVKGQLDYPASSISGDLAYPGGTIVGTITFPTDSLTAQMLYPGGNVSIGLSWPSL